MKKRPAIAFCLSSLGILVVAGVWFATSLAQGLSGMGSGASTGGYISVPIVVIPFATYFAAGVAAAVSESRTVRKIHAAVAHTVPFAAILGVGRDWPYITGAILLMFATFAFAWYRMLAPPLPHERTA